MTFGSRLKMLRTNAKLTHTTLSEAIGGAVSSGSISRYENNLISPTVPSVMALCKYFNVTSDWLIFGQESTSAKNPELINDPKLRLAIETLDKLYNSDDPNLRGWAIITFEKVFEDYIDKKNQQKEVSKAQ